MKNIGDKIGRGGIRNANDVRGGSLSCWCLFGHTDSGVSAMPPWQYIQYLRAMSSAAGAPV